MDTKVNEYIQSDYLRYKNDSSKLKIVKEIFQNKAFRYSVIIRLGNSYLAKEKNSAIFLLKIVKKILFFNSTIEIPFGVIIGKGLYMGHFSGITINPKVILGNNINIHKGVTIGQENRGIRKGTPVIGNKVWIGVNSTIVGNIKIGNNVLISPNSFVNFDIPSNSIVVGNKIIHSKNATDYYIS
ncbi:serine acetyltransferase [Enterococcus lemanii]|uniref:Serine acetyltransferase n=1 Tax=Enterococcus lemanii TaxID=1159752 RepID=A0ABV9MUP5_9ENTE|nr:serine acetyltransferase [Enterococcus lemanii]MBM7709265.1 serine O-acetyltransferase [Enterococcus lemanii]